MRLDSLSLTIVIRCSLDHGADYVFLLNQDTNMTPGPMLVRRFQRSLAAPILLAQEESAY